MAIEIARSLEAGPDYAPNWRVLVVNAYLEEVAASNDPLGHIQAVFWREKDPFVRQFLRFRFDGRCVNHGAFQYAVGCDARNRETGAASMIKAMLVADRTPEEIAPELGTAPLNIITFAKIYFDVRRFLSNEVFLRRLVFSDTEGQIATAEALRERRWLAAAFHRGWPGVQQVVFHRTPETAEELENLSMQLHGILTSRALEFAADLETSGMVPSEADLHRFLAAQNSQSRQPAKEYDGGRTLNDWVRALHGDLMEQVTGDSPALLKEIKAMTETKAVAPPVKRLRTRFVRS